MKQILISLILFLASDTLFAQHFMRIRVTGERDMERDHLSLHGSVISRDTTVVNAIKIDSGTFLIEVPVTTGPLKYEFTVTQNRSGKSFYASYAGSFHALKDTSLELLSPLNLVHPSHMIQKDEVFLTSFTLLPPGYDDKRSFAHIFFITVGEDLLLHDKAWWQNFVAGNNSPPFVITRVNVNSISDSSAFQEASAMIADTLSRYIRSNYRISPGKENFIITGVGEGATLALTAILDHEQVFGRAGMFLPEFSLLPPEAQTVARKYASTANGMFFFYIGSQENPEDRRISTRVMDELGAGSRSLIYAREDDKRSATPGDWRKWFPEFYRWVFSNGLNYIIK